MSRATKRGEREARDRDPRADLRAIWRAAIAAVEPEALVARRLARAGPRVAITVGRRRLVRPVARIWIAAAGKAAVAMARGAARALPASQGVAIAPRAMRRRGARAPARLSSRIRVLVGEHPIPGAGSFAATRALVCALARRPRDDTVLLLLSGGASALFALPATGIAPRDKTRLNRLLVHAGVPVEQMNAVRKHVSAVKGGGFLRLAAPREVITLALSDVVGDDPATIGSGPAVADPTLYADALAALRRALPERQIPAAVQARLVRGSRAARAPARRGTRSLAGRAEIPEETVKPGDPLLRRSHAAVIGSNRTALDGAARAARSLGYRVRRLRSPLIGEASLCGARLAASLPREPAHGTCFLAGGETVVSAHGSTGRGGRCQELALAAARELAGTGWILLAAGTDGVDGETPAAGAIVDGATLARSGAKEIERAFGAHDSYGYFRRFGGAFETGPTGTNTMDVVIALHRGRRPNERRSMRELGTSARSPARRTR